METVDNFPSNPTNSSQENVSPQTEPIVPSKLPGGKRPVVVIAVTVIVVLLTIVVGYFLSNQNKPVKNQYKPTTSVTHQVSENPTNEFNNWKTHTYKNGDISYSFQYPSDWVVINGSGNNDIENSPTIGLEAQGVKDFSSVGYGIGLNSPTITIEDLGYYHKSSTTGIDPNGPYSSIDNFIESVKNSNYDKIFEEKTVTVGDKLFKRIQRGYPNPQKYEYLISYPNSSLFVAISTPITNKELTNGEKINNLEIIEKVLSTFKFAN